MKEFAYIHEEGQLPDTLKGVPFLQSFQGEQLDDVLYSSSIIECEPGDEIIREGGSGSRIYILMAGVVDVIKGGEKLASFKHTGDLFGELAALGDEMRSATVKAASKTFLLAVDQKFLQDVKPKDQNPAFYAAFYEFLAKVAASRLKATSQMLTKVEHELHSVKAELEALKKEATPV